MTQCETLLGALKRGEIITPYRALDLCESLACHSRIAELRTQGYDIRCRIVTRNGKRWGEYYLVGQLEFAV